MTHGRHERNFVAFHGGCEGGIMIGTGIGDRDRGS